MLIYQKEQDYITEKLKQCESEVFNLEENLLKIANDCFSSLKENAQEEQINNFLQNQLQKTFEEIIKKSQSKAIDTEDKEEEKIEQPKATVSIQIKDAKKKELMDITAEATLDHHDLIFNSLPRSE